MRTSDMFKTKKVLSFEIFPPKQATDKSTIYNTLNELKELKPDFISVTNAAGGSKNNSRTLEIALDIKKIYDIECVVHLPCVNLSKVDILNVLMDLEKKSIKNVLALRGDLDLNDTNGGDFTYASDLISFIKLNGDFNVIGACYPEGHLECASIINDIHNLKAKVDAGADHLITQLFFDNDYFYTFRERAAIANINVPIQAGIMPVVNKRQIQRMVNVCGVKLPKKFISIMERYENNRQALCDAGIAYAVDQIVDLITHDVDGIHLYTMNNSYVTQKIYHAIKNLFVA